MDNLIHWYDSALVAIQSNAIATVFVGLVIFALFCAPWIMLYRGSFRFSHPIIEKLRIPALTLAFGTLALMRSDFHFTIHNQLLNSVLDLLSYFSMPFVLLCLIIGFYPKPSSSLKTKQTNSLKEN